MTKRFTELPKAYQELLLKNQTSLTKRTLLLIVVTIVVIRMN